MLVWESFGGFHGYAMVLYGDLSRRVVSTGLGFGCMFTGAFLVGFATGILRGFLGLYTRFFMVFFLDSLT